jgi:hypothetical protein
MPGVDGGGAVVSRAGSFRPGSASQPQSTKDTGSSTIRIARAIDGSFWLQVSLPHPPCYYAVNR